MRKARYFAGLGSGWLLGLLITGSAVVAGAGIVNPNRQESGWVSWLREEKLKLLNTDPGKLVVIGGSNAIFGIDASELQRLTSVRTVNAATHVNISYRLQERDPLGILQRGDIALMALEFQAYGRPDEMNQLSVEVGHQEGLGFFWSLPWRLKADYLRSIKPGFIVEQIVRGWTGRTPLPDYGYWQFGLTQTGDLDLSRARPNPEVVRKSAETFGVPRTIHGDFRRELCESVRSLASRGVRVIGTPDNVYLSREKSLQIRNGLLKQAEALFRQCGGEWLAVPSNGQLPLDMMLDTVFHPNAEGRRRRTQELAQALCRQVLRCPSTEAGEKD
jgi:hypothetical protein